MQFEETETPIIPRKPSTCSDRRFSIQSDALSSIASSIGQSFNLSQEISKSKSDASGDRHIFASSPFRSEDITGKTIVLVNNQELWEDFNREVNETGVITDLGVKMVLHKFVAEKVSQEDVSECMDSLPIKGSTNGGNLRKSVRSFSEANLVELNKAATSFGRASEAPRRKSNSYAPDSVSFFCELGAKVGQAVKRRSSSLSSPTMTTAGLSTEIESCQSYADASRRTSTSSASTNAANGLCLPSNAGMTAMALARAAALATLSLPSSDLEEEEVKLPFDESKMEPMPPRAMERMRRVSSMRHSSFVADFTIDEDSAELDLSDLEEDEDPQGKCASRRLSSHSLQMSFSNLSILTDDFGEDSLEDEEALPRARLETSRAA